MKRNQVETALSHILEPSASQPSSELKTRIKRLLDTDRNLGIDVKSNDQERSAYAFFRQAAPGSGFEVQFSYYDAFAILLGLQFMMHNWPQSFAVSVLRQTKRSLEKEFRRILTLDPKILFDPLLIRRLVPGQAVYDTTAPAFLTIVSRHAITRENENSPYSCAVFSDQISAMDWISKTTKGVGGGSSLFELTVAAHSIVNALDRTKPQPRGRTR